jgi:hypothetical protein
MITTPKFLLMLLCQVFGETGRWGDWETGRLGGWGRHLADKGNLLDRNCNIEEKELK